MSPYEPVPEDRATVGYETRATPAGRDSPGPDDSRSNKASSHEPVPQVTPKRFVPHWGNQAVGPAIAPGVSLMLEFCPECKLTWLCGKNGPPAVSSHPFDHDLSRHPTSTNMSLVVFATGYASKNGAGIGIYFGPDSRYNIEKKIRGLKSQNGSKADIDALSCTLESLQDKVLPVLKKLFPWIGASGSKDAPLRVIVVTDSNDILDNMSTYFPIWKEDANGGLKTSTNGELRNSSSWKGVFKQMDKLPKDDLRVDYCQVGRNQITGAKRLAQSGVNS